MKLDMKKGGLASFFTVKIIPRTMTYNLQKAGMLRPMNVRCKDQSGPTRGQANHAMASAPAPPFHILTNKRAVTILSSTYAKQYLKRRLLSRFLYPLP